MNKCHLNTELSSLEGTRSEFNRSKAVIKLGIDVHQDFYVVVEQMEGTNPKPAQRFQKQVFLHWAAKLSKSGSKVHAVYEACGFGFGLQRQLTAQGIHCYVVCPQKLDERNKRVKTDGLDAKALCLKLDRFVQGNREALALVRVPTEAEEQKRAIHRQREQLVKARKGLEAQGRSLLVNHGMEPASNWWKGRTFAQLQVPEWMKELLSNSQPILLALEEKIRALTAQLQAAAISKQPCGLGLLSSVVIDREIGSWTRFKNRRQVGSYTGLCPGEYSSGNHPGAKLRNQTRQPTLTRRASGNSLATGPLPAQLQTGAEMEKDPGQRSTGHGSCTQESHRSGGTAVGGRSVAHPHRPGCDRDIGINQLMVRGEKKGGNT